MSEWKGDVEGNEGPAQANTGDGLCARERVARIGRRRPAARHRPLPDQVDDRREHRARRGRVHRDRQVVVQSASAGASAPSRRCSTAKDYHGVGGETRIHRVYPRSGLRRDAGPDTRDRPERTSDPCTRYIADSLEDVVTAALRQHDADLASGAVVVVDESRTRVRILPISRVAGQVRE